MQKAKCRRRVGLSLFAVFAIFVTIFAMIVTSVTPAYAATKSADADTRNSYEQSLGANASTRYNGRVWTDKSVSSENISFSGDIGNPIVIKNDADFLVTYSALASTTKETGSTNAPLDVVFIIDDSSSMEGSALQNTVQAVNTSIKTLMDMNENNRVAVVLYARGGAVLLPLGHYDPTDTNGNYINYADDGRYFYNTVQQSVDYNNPSMTGNWRPHVNYDECIDMEQWGGNGRGTNIQMGVYTGMNILATEDETTVDVKGTTVKRTPSVILLSDGSPTFSSSSQNWWQPSNNNRQGPGNEHYYGNGMLAMATAQYMKQQITANYAGGDDASPYAAKVYTIGMGLDDLSRDEKDLAELTINPSDDASWTNNWGSMNSMGSSIQDKFNTYLQGRNVEVLVDEEASGGGWFPSYEDVMYTMRHPRTGDIDTLKYNDAYYSAANAGDVNGVFEEIVNQIALSTPQVPTEVTGGDPDTSGYITYTDPIGEYMEVKDVKALIYAGQQFNYTSKETVGNTTTYHFQGSVNSEVYGQKDISGIDIQVSEAADGKQTMTVRIPAALIPLRVNTITTDADGNVTQNKDNGAYPLRLVYSVGLKDSVDRTTLEGVSDEYIAAHTENGKVNFFSNLYSGNKASDDKTTIGDATVNFTPARTNPFYFFQSDVQLYRDANGRWEVTRNNYDENGSYYFPITYYQGSKKVTTYIQRSASLLNEYIGFDEQGNAYIRKDSPRLGNLADFYSIKTDGVSNTASASYYPTYDERDNRFVMYLGNNGKLQLEEPSALQITKSVSADEGLSAPNEAFHFVITIADKANQSVNAVLSQDGQADQTQVLDFDEDGKAKATLKDGQTLEIAGMQGKAYSVQEVDIPSGFTLADAQGSAGSSYDPNTQTVGGSVGDRDALVTFRNHYSVAPITSDALKLPLSGMKSITGRDFQEGDSFTFTIAAAAATPNAPLPQDENDKEVKEVTINPTGGTSADFSFDTITFTKPGEYRYIIREKAESMSGVDYDSAFYRVSVVIVDNGDGTLRLASVEEANEAGDNLTYTANPFIQKNAELVTAEQIAFTNAYSAESSMIGLNGMKKLESINSDRKLADGEFTFTIAAAGSKTTGSDGEFATDANQPMPVENGQAVTEATNIANGDVVFPGLTFTQDMVGKTYRYAIKENLPEGVNADNPTKDGMTYDTAAKYVYVQVSTRSENSKDYVVAAVVDENGDAISGGVHFQFTNRYEPTPVVIGDDTIAGIQVQKTFTGHEWTQDYRFTYELSALTADAPKPADMSETIGNPQSGTVNTASFGEMTFTKAGTYRYKLSEALPQGTDVQNPSKEGITYDTHTAYVTVTVTDVKGTLHADVTYDNSKAVTQSDKDNKTHAAFTNTYAATFDDATAINLSAGKQLIVNGNSNLTLESGMFFFMVTPLDNAPMGDGDAADRISVPKNDQNAYESSVQVLKNVRYAQAGTYEYIIQEQQGSQKGMAYDKSAYRVTVQATDNGKGVLSAKITSVQKGSYDADTQTFTKDAASSDNETIVFVNSYTPSQTTTDLPALKKVLSGDRSTPLAENEYSFELSVASANPENGIILPSQTTIGNKADGTVQFDRITFTKAGTYTVQVKEIVPDEADKVPGVEYDTHTTKITFTVLDENGQLVAYRTDTTGSLTFTNKYSATGELVGTEALKVNKSIDGREWKDGDSFSFTLGIDETDDATKNALDNGDIVLPDSTTLEITNSVANDGSGKSASFDNITFKKAGTYRFTISEEASSLGGITNDANATRTIVVKVSDQGNGRLTVELDQTESDDLRYVNHYALMGSTSYEIKGNKQLVGRENDQWLDSDSFTFKIEAGDEKTQQMIDEGKIKLDSTQQTVTKGKQDFSFNVSFDKIKGDYKFIVSEVVPSADGQIAGVSYDTKKAEVTVSVTDNQDGTITAAGKTQQQGDLTFTNTYAEKPTASDPLTISKKLSGRDMKAEEFDFTISAQTKDAPMPAAKQVTNKAAADGVWSGVSFGTISFEKEGIYEYLVKETIPQEAIDNKLNGVQYDTREYVVTYEVSAGENGYFTIDRTIKCDGKETDAITFENVYEVSPVIVGPSTNSALSGSKQVAAQEDMPYTMQGGEFRFRIEAAGSDPNAPLPENTEVSNQADGSFTFGDMTFRQKGRYQYVVSEVKTGVAGISYDAATYLVSIEISEDQTSGQLVAGTWEIQNASAIVFTNTYLPSAVSDSLHGIKMLDGRDMQDGEFTFQLSAADEETQSALAAGDLVLRGEGDALTTTSTKEGTFNFGDQAITFKKAGTYSFLLSEVAGADPNITYDSSAYTVRAIVSDENGALKVEWQNAENLQFSNFYKPFAGSISLQADKILNGRDMQAGEFTFQIEDESGNVIAQTANAADGSITFDAVTFDHAGTYHFTISEVGGTVKGVTYDAQRYHVSVKVEDVNGQLSAVEITAVNDQGKTVEEVVFTNSYQPDETSLTLGATKKLEGRTMKADEFSFVLKDTEGNTLQTTGNDENGFIAFDPITYEKAGTYRYTMEEVKGDDKTIAYDDTVYAITVEVRDDGNGNLQANVRYEGDKQPVFQNRYQEPKEDKPIDEVVTGIASDSRVWGGFLMIGILGIAIVNVQRLRKERR